MSHSINQYGLDILTNSCPYKKVSLTFEAYGLFKESKSFITHCKVIPPDIPSRPKLTHIVPCGTVPKRSMSLRGRLHLLHAIAHIELNAIDLAWDMICRFGHTHYMPDIFFKDWLKVAYDEAIHFSLLNKRLNDYGICYGMLPVHKGLWDSAYDTRNNFSARLAVVPMVLEARGLDVTPKMIDGLKDKYDLKTIEILKRIYSDEISHVYYGVKWFEYVSGIPITQAKTLFHDLLKKYFTGKLIPPFNIPARDKTEMPRPFYQDY